MWIRCWIKRSATTTPRIWYLGVQGRARACKGVVRRHSLACIYITEKRTHTHDHHCPREVMVKAGASEPSKGGAGNPSKEGVRMPGVELPLPVINPGIENGLCQSVQYSHTVSIPHGNATAVRTAHGNVTPYCACAIQNNPAKVKIKYYRHEALVSPFLSKRKWSYEG